MSIEREILVRAKVLIECLDTSILQDQADIILSEIKKLLVQPEPEQESLGTQINFKDSSGKLITVDTYFVRELVERYAEVSSEGTWHRKGYKDRSWGI